MLVLTRRLGEGLIIGDNIKITVEKISKSEIKIAKPHNGNKLFSTPIRREGK